MSASSRRRPRGSARRGPQGSLSWAACSFGPPRRDVPESGGGGGGGLGRAGRQGPPVEVGLGPPVGRRRGKWFVPSVQHARFHGVLWVSPPPRSDVQVVFVVDVPIRVWGKAGGRAERAWRAPPWTPQSR